ncbi:hypothetical protein [Nonomuraea sp. NPDC002799]
MPCLLDGRCSGPVFLTDRRARVPLPPADVDPSSGRARVGSRSRRNTRPTVPQQAREQAAEQLGVNRERVATLRRAAQQEADIHLLGWSCPPRPSRVST